jgi:hypothetical protein
MTEFSHIPSEQQLISISRQIDRQIAAELLHYAEDWSSGSRAKQLEIINELVQRVDTLGKPFWHDIVWEYLVSRIHTLSHKINETVASARRR